MYWKGGLATLLTILLVPHGHSRLALGKHRSLSPDPCAAPSKVLVKSIGDKACQGVNMPQVPNLHAIHDTIQRDISGSALPGYPVKAASHACFEHM